MNAYYIIGIAAVVLIIYFTFLGRYTKKRKEKQFEPFKKRHQDKELTEEQKQALCYGAILSYHRIENIFSLIPTDIIEAYQQGLKNQWQITDSESAKMRLSRLSDLVTSREIDSILEQDAPELSKIQEKIASKIKLDLNIVANVKSTYAWDLGRAIPLAKWCYWCGYITENEMWQYMSYVAQTAQRKGTDWTEYTVSFLLGRTISGFDLDDVSIEAKQILNGGSPFLRYSDNIDIYKTYRFK